MKITKNTNIAALLNAYSTKITEALNQIDVNTSEFTQYLDKEYFGLDYMLAFKEFIDNDYYEMTSYPQGAGSVNQRKSIHSVDQPSVKITFWHNSENKITACIAEYEAQ